MKLLYSKLGGSVTIRNKTFTWRAKKDIYSCRFLKLLIPHLIVKKEHAKLLLRFEETVDNFGKRPDRLGLDRHTLQKREDLWIGIKILNRYDRFCEGSWRNKWNVTDRKFIAILSKLKRNNQLELCKTRKVTKHDISKYIYGKSCGTLKPAKYDFTELECEQPTETEFLGTNKKGNFLFGKTKKLRILTDKEYRSLKNK
jgi:hypothetical protein